MAYEVNRHPLVRADLVDITILIGEYAGYATAESKIAQIEQKLNSLTDFPHIGTTHDDIYPGLRAIPVVEKGVVCFTVNERTATVNIICISYAGADWMSRVKERR
jgi:plasmid stabilization system protein ParE